MGAFPTSLALGLFWVHPHSLFSMCPRSLAPFSGEWCSVTKAWMVGMVSVTGVLCPWALPVGRAGKCVHTHKGRNTQTQTHSCTSPLPGRSVFLIASNGFQCPRHGCFLAHCPLYNHPPTPSRAPPLHIRGPPNSGHLPPFKTPHPRPRTSCGPALWLFDKRRNNANN